MWKRGNIDWLAHISIIWENWFWKSAGCWDSPIVTQTQLCFKEVTEYVQKFLLGTAANIPVRSFVDYSWLLYKLNQDSRNC